MTHRVRSAVLMFTLARLQVLFAQTASLQRIGSMPVDGIKGEFDHFAIDLVGDRLYLAAEDQKTVEVFDLKGQKHIGSISLFSRPDGLVFLPGSSRLMVSDGGVGTVKFIDTETAKLSSQIKTELRADSVTFDPSSQTMFVINGGIVAKLDHSFITGQRLDRPAN